MAQMTTSLKTDHDQGGRRVFWTSVLKPVSIFSENYRHTARTTTWASNRSDLALCFPSLFFDFCFSPSLDSRTMLCFPLILKIRSLRKISRSMQRSPLAYPHSSTSSLCHSLVPMPSICCPTSLLLFLQRILRTTTHSLPFPLPHTTNIFEVSRTDRLDVQEVQEIEVSRSY